MRRWAEVLGCGCVEGNNVGTIGIEFIHLRKGAMEC